MRKLATPVLLSLIWAGCAVAEIGDRFPPEAYLDPVDQEIARTGVAIPGRPYPCARESTMNGIKVVISLPTEECVRMLPPERMRGLWFDQFEGSRFCPEPATTCAYDTPGDRIWLDIRQRSYGQMVYEVEFIGRRTAYKGSYGHFGGSDYEIVVDRIISIKAAASPKVEGQRSGAMR